MAMTQSALYLFCFARSDLVGEVEGSGVDGRHPVSPLRCSPDLCAIVSEAPLEDFCGEAAELNMQQLAWVGPCALRHEAVIEQVMRHSPVLPVRFGTLFSSQKSLKEFLDMHHQTIAQFLRRVAGLEEWSIKGMLDKKQAVQGVVSASLAAQHGRLATLAPGTRYFQEQQIRSAAEKELRHWLNETCRQVAGDTMRMASDFRECPVVSAVSPDGGPEVVLNWAFLLPAGATAPFRSRIDQLNQQLASQGLTLELSGPWPPYRFVPPLSMGTAP